MTKTVVGGRMSLYTLLACISVIPIVASAIVVYKNRHIKGGDALFLYTLSLLIWQGAAAIESITPSLLGIKIMAKIGHLGYAFNPFLLLLFSIYHSGAMTSVPRRGKFFLFLSPVIMLIGSFTNQFHGLVWESVTLHGENGAIFSHGPLFYLFGAAMFVASISLFILTAMRYIDERSNRLQGFFLITGYLCHWWAGLFYLTGWNPFTGYDLVALACAFPALGILAASVWGDLFKQPQYESSIQEIFSRQ